MTRSYRHKRSKQRLMQYFFIVCKTCSDKGRFRSDMHMRMELMEHMAVYLPVDTGRIDLIR